MVYGALYKSMEFTGEGVKSLSMDDRLCIANMAIEAGAKNGIFPVDDITREYIKDRFQGEPVEFSADDDAVYDEEYTIDLSKLRPTVAFPHLPENTRTVDEIGDTEVKIDQATDGENDRTYPETDAGSCQETRLHRSRTIPRRSTENGRTAERKNGIEAKKPVCIKLFDAAFVTLCI